MIEDFERDGFVTIDNFIHRDVVEELIQESDRLANGNYVNILDSHRKSKPFYNLLTNEGIILMADKLQQHKMIPVGSILFFCKPGNSLENGSNFHQDNYAAKAPLGSYLTCGVALDDADETNGGLIVYPGTHKLGHLDSEASINFQKDGNGNIIKSYPIGNKVLIPYDYSPLQLTYEKGSLIFIHSNLIHGCPKNPSPDRWRRTIYLNYIKDGHPFWPGWNSRREIMERYLSFEKFQNYER